MRLLCAALAVALLGTANPSRAGGDKKDEDRLQGTWVVQGIVYNGLVIEQKEIVDGDIVLVIAGDKLTSNRPGKEGLESTFKLDATKTPKTIDTVALGGRHKGKTVPGIYQLDGDTLKLCAPVDPEGAKRPTEFAAPQKSGLTLMTLKRTK